MSFSVVPRLGISTYMKSYVLRSSAAMTSVLETSTSGSHPPTSPTVRRARQKPADSLAMDRYSANPFARHASHCIAALSCCSFLLTSQPCTKLLHGVL